MIIRHQKGRGNKVHILIDDEYAVTTDINFWCDNYIPDGTQISEDEWNSLVEKINYKKALNKCADFLARRDHSIKELKVKLMRTVDEKSAQKAIDRYIEAGYLDDERYCERLVEYLYNEKKYSSRRIKNECYRRGIDSDTINSVLGNFDFDNISSIVDIIEKKYMSKLDSEDSIRKVITSLQRKGFDYYDIRSALNEIKENEI